MAIKNKKIGLTMLSLASLTLPIFSVIACSDDNQNISGGINPLFDQTMQALKKRINSLKNVNSTTLSFTKNVFVSDFSRSLNASDLGLIFDGQVELWPNSIKINENYYILEIDATLQKIKIQVNLSIGDNTSFNAQTTFFKISNFGQKFDLENLSSFNPLGNDPSFSKIIAQSNQIEGNVIKNALEIIVEKYVNLQVAGAKRDIDYEISDLQTIDSETIMSDNLQDNARSYKALISAKSSSSKMTNQTTININLPQFNFYDLAQFPNNFISSEDDWQVDDPQNVAANYVIKIIKKQIISKINEINQNVSWDDLFATYALSGQSMMLATLDLTNPYLSIAVKIDSLPYSKNVINKQTIEMLLPSLTG